MKYCTKVVSQGFLYIVVQASGLRLVQAESPHHKEFHCKADVGTPHLGSASSELMRSAAGAGEDVRKAGMGTGLGDGKGWLLGAVYRAF